MTPSAANIATLALLPPRARGVRSRRHCRRRRRRRGDHVAHPARRPRRRAGRHRDRGGRHPIRRGRLHWRTQERGVPWPCGLWQRLPGGGLAALLCKHAAGARGGHGGSPCFGAAALRCPQAQALGRLETWRGQPQPRHVRAGRRAAAPATATATAAAAAAVTATTAPGDGGWQLIEAAAVTLVHRDAIAVHRAPCHAGRPKAERSARADALAKGGALVDAIRLPSRHVAIRYVVDA